MAHRASSVDDPTAQRVRRPAAHEPTQNNNLKTMKSNETRARMRAAIPSPVCFVQREQLTSDTRDTTAPETTQETRVSTGSACTLRAGWGTWGHKDIDSTNIFCHGRGLTHCQRASDCHCALEEVSQNGQRLPTCKSLKLTLLT